tara:strand:+ start:37 stop:201 length:165 start_codon:yes stop_codon:yes gene_type:complete
MIKIKIFMTISIDPEEYPIPSDGDVTEDFEESLNDFFYDIGGVDIKNMKIITET